MITESDRGSQEMDEESSQPEAQLMSISKEVVLGADNSKTLQLQSIIQGQEVVMLVDSGSSHCFINEDLVLSLLAH